tara:strand:+ start:102 stop:287 length:186 start_codon:yes stop_codon:yes gene_type:complete
MINAAKIATPPRVGVLTECSFLGLGLSFKFLSSEIFIIVGIDRIVRKQAVKKDPKIARVIS